MKQLTIKDIRDLEPCYDPAKYIPENWQGTLVDILKIDECRPQDRLWVVTKLLDDKTNRLFAVWCAREALKLVDNPDKRSIEACDVAEKFANGEASKEELAAARAAAAWVAWDAWDAGDAAAWAAAAWAAAWAADAADAAAARAAAWAAAAWAAQIKHLIEMIKEQSE